MKKLFKKVYIEISNVCNLKCPFCSPTNRPQTMMTAEKFGEIIKQVKEYSDYIYLHVKGEPLIHPQFMEILSIAEANKMKVNITTNGVMINKVKETLFASKAIHQINISLHSMVCLNDKEKEIYLEVGMNDYLLSPLSFEVFKKLILEVLDKRLDEDINKVEIKPKRKIIEVNFSKSETMKQLGLDEDTIDMLLANFFSTLEHDIQKLENAIDSSIAQDIVQASHYLKSSSVNLVMKEASLILENIEKDAKNGKVTFEKNVIEDLKYIFKKIKESI